MIYIYKAINKNNKIIENRIEANSELEVLQFLRSKELRPIKVSLSLKRNEFKFERKFSKVEFKFIFMQLSIMLSNNITMYNAIEIISNQFKGFKRNIFLNILNDLSIGNSLSIAFKNQNIFPKLIIGITKIGEESANLPYVFKKIANHYEKEISFENKIKNALYYPIILIIITIFILNFIVLNILPNLSNILSSEDFKLPLITQILINTSLIIKNKILYILLGLLIIISLIYIYLKTPKGALKLDKTLLSFQFYKKLIIKRFCSIMYILLEANLNLSSTVDLIHGSISNRAFNSMIENSINDLKNGISFSDSLLKYNFFPEMLILMIKTGEESSSIKDIFKICSEYYSYELENSEKKFITLLEPSIILILSIIVGFIVLSVVLPILNISDIL